MSQSNREQRPDSRGIMVALGAVLLLTLIVLAGFIAYSHLPRAGGQDGTYLDLTPTAQQTNPVATLQLNRMATYSGVNITVTQVGEAGNYSDDTKQQGKYTVRVYTNTENTSGAPVGIDYLSLARLIMPDGKQISPKLITLAPVVLPNQKQSGYLDFAVDSQVSIATLSLRMGKKVEILFS